MSTATVRPNDSAFDIARRFGISHAALVAANPAKPTFMLAGVPTFRELAIGETLALPAGGRLAGPGTLGDPNSDGTFAALVALSTSNPTLFATPNLTVLAFQQSYNGTSPATALSEDGEYGANTATAAATYGTAPAALTTFSAENATDLANWLTAVNGDTTICAAPNNNVLAFQVCCNKVTGSTLTADGEWGPASAGAAAGLIGTTNAGSNTTAPAACANYTPAAGTTPAPAPAPGPVTPPTTTIVGSTSSNTALVVGLVAAAALGTFGYLHYKKHGTVVPKAVSRRLGPASHPAHRRLAAGR